MKYMRIGTVAATTGRHAARSGERLTTHTSSTAAGNVTAISFDPIANAAPSTTPIKYTRRVPARIAHTNAAAYPAAAISSARPTTLATASTCTGWTENSTPTINPTAGPASSHASRANNAVAIAAQRMLTA